MPNYELRKHKTADAVKWVVVFLLVIGLIGAVITLFVMLDRQTTVTEIGAEQYIIGGLDDEGAAIEGDTSIVTRGTFTTDGLKVELADEAKVTYELYFYDADGEFVSKTAALSADFDGSAIPENAETAKIVNPSKRVLLPAPEAGCSLADSCPAEELAAFKAAHPELYVVAYINCSAEVKALADVICTSGNAKKIVERVPADKEILFVPDQNLGAWVAGQTGRKIRLWPGSCYAHVLFSVREIRKAKEAFPGAPVLVHPECVESVRAEADLVCSTEKMVDFCKAAPADTFIIVTETNMIARLRHEIPGKKFVA